MPTRDSAIPRPRRTVPKPLCSGRWVHSRRPSRKAASTVSAADGASTRRTARSRSCAAVTRRLREASPSSKFTICRSSIFFCWNLRFRYPAVAIIGIMNTNMSENGLRVIENMNPPMSSGANIMKIGKNCGLGSFGGVGAFRGR